MPPSQQAHVLGRGGDRVIQPDAVLEMPGAEQRYFLSARWGRTPSRR